jgi:Mg-chelatase subunit ChlD
MRRGSINGNIKVWALALSVLLHIGVMGGFVFMSFGGEETEANDERAPARLSRNIIPVRADKNFIKPKVIKPNLLDSGEIEISDLPKTEIKRISNNKTTSDAGSKNINLVEESFVIDADRIEFFSSTAFRKKVCFVVDSSGSMQGSFGWVKEQLTRSISNLEQDQYFNIIFFGSDALTQFGDDKFVRASNKNKQRAKKFISMIRPSGGTNALAGLKKALRVCAMDEPWQAAVFFLTDGFELGGEGSADFAAEVNNFRKALAPATKINTIGFEVNAENRNMLINIASSAGGSFVEYEF